MAGSAVHMTRAEVRRLEAQDGVLRTTRRERVGDGQVRRRTSRLTVQGLETTQPPVRPPASSSVELRLLSDILARLGRLEEQSLTGPMSRVPPLEMHVNTLDKQVGRLLSLESRVDVLETQSHAFESRLGALESQADLLHLELLELSSHKQDTENSVDSLTQQVTGFDKELEALRAALSAFETDLKALQAPVLPDNLSDGDPQADSHPQSQVQSQAAPTSPPPSDSDTESASSAGSRPIPAGAPQHTQQQAPTVGTVYTAPTVGLDPSIWETEGKLLPSNPRGPPDFPVLAAPGNSGGMSFMRWQATAYAELQGAGIAAVVDHVAPTPQISSKVLAAYRRASGIVFACMQRACANVPVVRDEVMNVARQPDYGLRAWLAIRDHYIKLASTNRSLLQAELKNLKPRDGETMDSLLARCETLRTKYQMYNLVLQDRDLIVQIFTGLAHSWRTAVRQFHPGAEPEDLSWSSLSQDLRRVDTERRQSCTTVPGAELPLGYGQKGKKQVSDAGGSTAQGHQAQGKNKQKGSKSPRSQSPQKKSAAGAGPSGTAPSQNRGIIVCYCCHGAHMISECPKKPKGWKLTPELKAAADKIRDAKIEQQKANRKVTALIAQARVAITSDSDSDTAQTSAVRARSSTQPSDDAPGAAAPGRTI